ncbi:alpha/beta hydrolase [Labrys okinawensis]|uniref:alpha/beta hydrolase n=1 Tax=Labrys okinawensis TaxID=346911 RepID=UPI0039BC8873
MQWSKSDPWRSLSVDGRLGSVWPTLARMLYCCARLLSLTLALALSLSSLLLHAQAGTMQQLSVPSPALGHPLEVSIYVPNGPVPTDGWPVLYLLHGVDGSARDWSTLGDIQSTLDRLVQTGRIRPILVVMPDTGNSWYVNSAKVGGPGNYEDAILLDLPRAIEGRFAPNCRRETRAIAGISMGGFGALRLAFKRPDRYVAVASLSGALWQNIPESSMLDGGWKGASALYFQRIDAATVVSGLDLPPPGTYFAGAFGSPFKAASFNRANVFTVLGQQISAGTTLPAIYLAVGDHDSDNLWRGSIALYDTLKADHLKVELRIFDGDHSWSFWKPRIEDMLEFVDASFVTRPAGSLVASRPVEAPPIVGTAVSAK